MRSAGNRSSNMNGPSPLMLTVSGVPLNPVPPRWQGTILNFGP